MNAVDAIKNEISKLRENNVGIITVSNTEWYSLFKDEIRNSIAIEGVFANRNDLLDVLERNKKTDKQKTASILGYFESASSMYEYAYNQFKEKEFQLRLADIRQIHTLLMRYEKNMGTYIGELGEFRKGNVEVAIATFKPIDVYYVRDAMKLLVEWINLKLKDKKYDPIRLVAVSHVWFETIHPFRDGNGRVGRIFLSYLLIGLGLVNVAIKGVAKSDREKYYRALEVCDDCFTALNGDIEKRKKITAIDIESYICGTDFGVFEGMIEKRLEDSIKRLRLASKDRLTSDAVLSLHKLSQAFNYSQDYLRNLINRKQLAAHKKGKLWYVKVKDMKKYVDK